MVRTKRFREDLYFRLNVVTLYLPPLRERGDDIILLAEHFLKQFAEQIGRLPLKLTDKARQRLMTHPWPGNVRELRNMMERVAYLASDSIVEESDLAFVLAPSQPADAKEMMPGSLTLTDATADFQRAYIQRHIDAAGGNVAQAAERLGLHRSNLYRKMRQLGLDAPD
jgi:Nif-specific regulatory protein